MAPPAIQGSASSPPSQRALLSPPSTAPPPLTSCSLNSLHITHHYCWRLFTISPTALWAQRESELSFVSLTAAPPVIRVCSMTEWMNENPHNTHRRQWPRCADRQRFPVITPVRHRRPTLQCVLDRHRVKTRWNSGEWNHGIRWLLEISE